ncbi:MAG: NADH-quinone oxidoreductase subunit C, partial [Candidatus Omnitrophica bacterium]|nr:NADH-quinone oxidoreductase subunit C [Candidatus Omnitrophota bacterium]
LYLTVENDDFARAALALHKRLDSGVMMFFAQDLRAESGKFRLYCVFLDSGRRSWVVLCRDVEAGEPVFASLAKEMYSAAFFEREMKEMFGIMPQGNPDVRRLRLHDEIWPEGYYPLRKDFTPPQEGSAGQGQYRFHRVEGEGIFEVPVGPVHAGIIGPGHFRFSVAGEPIISLEIRHGWTHRGIEKLLEGKTFLEAADLCERISGDTAFGYSWAFCQSVEKISGCKAPARAQLIRVIYLELERVYNHINDMGGIALDVGFSFPAQFAAMIKERLLRLNGDLCGSRYLKGVNTVGGIRSDIDAQKQGLIRSELAGIEKDFLELQKMLFSSVSFMDRVDATGILRTKTARDLNITGVAARASGIALDMRKDLPSIYRDLSFTAAKGQAGDVAARLKVRCDEVDGSLGLIRQCLDKLSSSDTPLRSAVQEKEGFALGCVEAWRGPLRVWTRLDAHGRLLRCKIVDPSFQNWEGLAFAVLGNIIPDFPLCNKSFDLSYSANDL